jgi:hypothetical protein
MVNMSPEERDRLVKVEQIVAAQKEDLDEIKASLHRLEALANMGRGALGFFLKAGAVAAVVIAAIWAVFDKFHKVSP